MMTLKNVLAGILLFWVSPLMAETQVMAAENIYGDVAKQIGGHAVIVHSIMNNPNQDPHLFSVDVKTHALLSNLTADDIVIINGAGYDPWAIHMINNTPAIILNVATLNHVPEGANPHLWYDLRKVDVLAKQLAEQLSKAQPSNKKLFAQNLKIFLTRSQHIQERIQALRSVVKNCPIIATEPVANELAEQLGLDIHAQHFQLSVMNDVEPSAQDRRDFLRQVTQHTVIALVYNRQVTNPTPAAMRVAAEQAGLPIIGVYELLPEDQKNFLDYYQSILDEFQKVLEAGCAKTNHCI